MELYTDGSCLGNPGPGGYGVVVLHNGSLIKTMSGGESYTTNNRMEMTGILVALDYGLLVGMISSDPSTHKIHIYSDSNYCIKGITEWRYNWIRTGKIENVANSDLWKLINIKLNEIKSKNIYIEFHWVKGHASNPYNNMADQLAVEYSKIVQDKNRIGIKSTINYNQLL